MKIPQGEKRRDRFRRFDFFRQLIERCRVSRVERRERYTSRRLHWLYGTDGSFENTDIDFGRGPPPGNKIYPHLDYVTSFLYAAETTRFACQIGAEVPKPFMHMVPKVNERINEIWHASNTDIIVANAITLALVFDSMFIKPMWRGNNVYPGVVYPHNFGVLREDVTMLSRQEAFCHWFPMTVGQFRTDFAELPRLNAVLDQVNKRASGMIEAAESGLNRIIMSSQAPLGGTGIAQGAGMVDWLTQVGNSYVPRVREELIEMVELFVWDDALNDYRIVTFADPDIVIFDRPAKDVGWLEQECPFVQICPNPDSGYFWGFSECERLQALQSYRNRCLAQIDHLQDLQAHPPSTSSGFPGDLAEIHYVLDTPNGMLNQPDPAGIGGGGPKADRVKIELPSDLYERLARIDDMFDEMSGLPPIARGLNPPGVRGGGHAMDLAKLGTARIKRRAMVIEDQLEQLATVYLRLMAKYDPTQLEAPVEAGKQDQVEQFILKQFPDSFTVKVDGHSNSPIFVDDQTALAFQLLKAKAIDRETLLDMVPIPSRQLLIHKLKDVIEPAEAAAQKAEHDFEIQKAQAAGNRGRPRKPAGGGNGAAAPE